MSLERLRAFCLSLPGVTEKVRWGADLCFDVGDKMFTVTGVDDGDDDAAPAHGAHRPVTFTLKAREEEFDELVARPGVIPAPYLARAKWVAVAAWDTLPWKEVERLLRTSYELVRAGLPKKVQASLGAGGAAEEDVPSMRTRRRPAPAKPKRAARPGRTASVKAKPAARAKKKR